MDFIELKDSGFQKVVRAALKKLDGKLKSEDLIGVNGILITDEDVDGIQIPWHCDADVFNMTFPEVIFNINNSENGKWLEDLKLFQHIKSLYLYVAVDNLSLLNEFTALKELYIKDSNETEWSFIENMLMLRYLSVHKSGFNDITPIAILYKKQLEFYNKGKNDVNDQKFNFFSGLENLYLDDCNISDISSLSECSYLSDVNLSHNKIRDLSPLSNLSSLYYLTIRYNNITDINPLKGLKGLYYLNLRHNHIVDISILKDFENSNIRRLFLQYNNITDFSSIYNIMLIDNDIFDGFGKNRILRTNIAERIPEQFLGDLKFNDELSQIYNPQLRKSIRKYEKIGLYYGMDEWNKCKRVHLLLSNNNKENDEGKDFERNIHTSSVRKIVLENSNTNIRLITRNSQYVFTGDPQKILEYYNKNFSKTSVVKSINVNKIRCKLCGDTIVSESVHDFKFCSCHSIAVDGGQEYLRRCGNEENFEDLTEYGEMYE
ncbi:hypothetical protein G9F71_016370 [Clostridium sp. FP2]|uniref:leucine-rich repeat domain-containing protein n=1 Tax=Clostridium sp. FP2 TaxID=2724481 RepID=UPI0013E98445|nr:leucine-rich repeat domain-containing protein [Clostridium sp. FP2]MBZ9624427.1 hypothetical protein [Clostridium sp. FP2]